MLDSTIRFVLSLVCAALAAIGFEWVAPGQRLQSSRAFLMTRRAAGSDDGDQIPQHYKVFYASQEYISPHPILYNPHKERWVFHE